MAEPKPTQHRLPAYKELTIHQLRSLVETARQGSQASAARKLGLAQPTVWEQLHALERELGAQLLQGHGRGSQLTDDGKLLVELAIPILNELDRLPVRFQEQRGKRQPRLPIAATPRTLQEDLPGCIVEFERRFPDVLLTLVEVDDDAVAGLIEDQKVELGFTPSLPSGAAAKDLDCLAGYVVDQYLVTPHDHPLARKRVVRVEDLLQYPLVNGPGACYGETMRRLQVEIEAGNAPPRRVEAFFSSTICKFVKLGFGIGIVGRVSGTAGFDPELRLRSMSKELGQFSINIIRRRGDRNPLADAFIQVVQELLGRPRRVESTGKR